MSYAAPVSCGRTYIRSSVALVCRAQCFRSLFQTQQHAPRHEKPRRLDRVREQPGPERLRTDAAARHESGSGLVNRVQPKLPHPIKAAHVPHIQYERSIGFENGDRPAWASADRNVVTNREVLK